MDKGREKVTEQNNEAVVYNINKDYRIVRIKGNKCSLFFKNRQNQLLATLEGCREVFSQVLIPENGVLSDLEKGYLVSFIRAKKCSISKDVANVLGVSTIKYLDGREEYLSEKQLKRKIALGIDFAKVYVVKLSARSIRIPAGTRDCSYVLSNAKVSRIIIDEDCSINLDLRDNQNIDSLIIGERFSGTVNLSRTTVASIFIANNCRCNLSISDSKKCFNLQIADIYSGNLSISNSCLYALGIGYYSYADIMLSNNILKKDIVVGDSFRGVFYATNQSVDVLKIGDDCKGTVKVNNYNNMLGVRKLAIGDDFGGSLNITGDDSIETLEIGRKMSGKVDASFSGSLRNVTIGKYYSGNMIFDESSIEHIEVAYGASGILSLEKCKKFGLLQATEDNNLIIKNCCGEIITNKYQGNVFYSFDKNNFELIKEPFYKKIYNTIYERFIE